MTSHALGRLEGSRRTSWLLSWKCDVKSKIRFRQSMRIYLQNIPATFHPDPFWNEGVLGFFEERRPNKKQKNRNNNMSSDIGSVPDPKSAHNKCIHAWHYKRNTIEWIGTTKQLTPYIESQTLYQQAIYYLYLYKHHITNELCCRLFKMVFSISAHKRCLWYRLYTTAGS